MMQSQDKYRIALLSAYAIAIHSFENLLPTPIPWLRLGIANIITLATLVLYGFRAAMMVTLIRVIISSIFIGTFLGPGFIMSFLRRCFKHSCHGDYILTVSKALGPVGLSLIGALFHNVSQLLSHIYYSSGSLKLFY